MLIDTHAHLNFNSFKDDADEVIRRSLENNVWLINVGSQYTTSRRAVAMAERYPEGVYAAIGLHPIHSQDEFEYSKYKELARSKKVVAIGEIGLDYKLEYSSFKEKQRIVFCQQLDLAKELSLPIIFHCRMAHDDLIKEIRFRNEIGSHKITGVIHCFTGTWQQAQKYLEMGLHLGFNGIIFKLDLDDIIKKAPLERILLETDCPYLTPPLPADLSAEARKAEVEALAKAGPMTGRNEPIYVQYVAEKIAKIKNLSYEEIAQITTQNAQKLFEI